MPEPPRQSNKKQTKDVLLTIGTFDGVHIGHQRIINRLVENARKLAGSSVVVTFFPNPIVVLKNIQKPVYLTSPEEKLEILEKLGVDSVLTIQFDRELSRRTASEFMSMLQRQLDFSCLLIGHDFRLGANREGDFQKLKAIGEELGYEVEQVEPLEMDGSPVSSTRTRQAIQKGDMQNAARYLGRYYQVAGKVIHGDGRGKHIGLPTANILPWEYKLIPSFGVYSAFVIINGKTYPSVVNIGSRPTFYDPPAEQSIEVHILDYSNDLYDENLSVMFVDCIRPELKFESVDTLMDVIRNDIAHARKVLADDTVEKYLPA